METRRVCLPEYPNYNRQYNLSLEGALSVSMVLPLLLSLTRAHFLRRAVAIAIGGASFVASNSHPQLVKADSVEMSRSPDFSVWDALLKAHVKPTTMRGIPVHAVDYEGTMMMCDALLR